jgi:hypothetical protein
VKEEVWLSGERTGAGEPFVWTTAENRTLTYTHWQNEIPPPESQVGCIYVVATVSSGYSWSVGDCAEERFVLCEYPAPA